MTMGVNHELTPQTNDALQLALGILRSQGIMGTFVLAIPGDRGLYQMQTVANHESADMIAHAAQGLHRAAKRMGANPDELDMIEVPVTPEDRAAAAKLERLPERKGRIVRDAYDLSANPNDRQFHLREWFDKLNLDLAWMEGKRDASDMSKARELFTDGAQIGRPGTLHMQYGVPDDAQSPRLNITLRYPFQLAHLHKLRQAAIETLTGMLDELPTVPE